LKITYLITGNGVSATLPSWETFTMCQKVRNGYTLQTNCKLLKENQIRIEFFAFYNYGDLDELLLSDLQELIDNEILNPFFVSVCKRINDEQNVISLSLDCQTITYDKPLPEPKVPLFDIEDTVRVKNWPLRGYYANGFGVVKSIINLPDNEEVKYEIDYRGWGDRIETTTIRESRIVSPNYTALELSVLGLGGSPYSPWPRVQ
jgi:hypothetical protein